MAHNFQLNEETSELPQKRKATSSGIIGLLIKLGLVKTPAQANILMIVIIIVGISAIIYINLRTFGG